jgi:hypothetical protein
MYGNTPNLNASGLKIAMPKSKDRKHYDHTHMRWMEKVKINRVIGSPDYDDAWFAEQCFGCLYFIKLEGILGSDWGVCSNELSPFDGHLMYEHDGCEYFEDQPDEGSDVTGNLSD